VARAKLGEGGVYSCFYFGRGRGVSAVPVLKANRESVSGQPPAGYSYVKLTRRELKRFVGDGGSKRPRDDNANNAAMPLKGMPNQL
jgi:hypothetical protein